MRPCRARRSGAWSACRRPHAPTATTRHRPGRCRIRPWPDRTTRSECRAASASPHRSRTMRARARETHRPDRHRIPICAWMHERWTPRPVRLQVPATSAIDLLRIVPTAQLYVALTTDARVSPNRHGNSSVADRPLRARRRGSAARADRRAMRRPRRIHAAASALTGHSRRARAGRGPAPPASVSRRDPGMRYSSAMRAISSVG